MMPTILVIDDEEPIRMLLRTTLEAAGYTVREAANGRVGLGLYQSHPSDLVITDLLMHEMNGLDLIIELTRGFLNVKVIAMTGASGEKNGLNTAKLLGARHTLRKPFSMAELLRTVQYELAH